VRTADGAVERVVETKKPGDATPAELEIREVNAGVYAFAGGELLDALAEVGSDNAQGELYLPDALPILRARGRVVRAHLVDDPALALGVNDRGDLAKVRDEAQRRIHARHLAAGVTIVDPGSTTIDVGVEIGADTVIAPFSSLHGSTTVGAGSQVGPQTTLIDATLGDGVAVPHSYLTSCTVEDGASVGPFAYLRPGAVLREGAKVGTFVEVKNSDVGAGTKVPHLSYIGDADIGPGSNLGAGTITANYDGARKHRTTIGARVRGGVDTAFVVTEDVPEGALGVARARQRNVERYGERKKEIEDQWPPKQ
jgi:bifunctional UDP-N-acetylglucosamine pyrophosphorylase/glucosamine-1-phosphate N-acetyltransferase